MIRGEINYLPTQPGIGKAPDLAEHKNNILLQTSKSRIHYSPECMNLHKKKKSC